MARHLTRWESSRRRAGISGANDKGRKGSAEAADDLVRQRIVERPRTLRRRIVYVGVAFSKRSLARHVAGAVGRPLAWALEHSARMTDSRVGLVLMLHGVGDPQGNLEKELVPRLGTRLFEAQLRHLAEHYRVVRASELLEAVAERKQGQRFPAAITFDDDFASHASVAMPILERVGLTATFFISGSSLVEPSIFWWDVIERAMNGGGDGSTRELAFSATGLSPSDLGDPRAIYRVADAIVAMPPTKREAFVASLTDLLGADHLASESMPAEHLRALIAGGFDIGFHTLRHDPLTLLEDDALHLAMREGRERVEEIVGRKLELIAYPHGKVDSRVTAAAREAGFRFGFTAELRAADAETDPMLLPRIAPSFVSASHFAVKLALMTLQAVRSSHGAVRTGAVP